MARMSQEARVQLEAFKAVRVKHPRLEEVDDLISQAIEEHAAHSHLLVYGPSGVGKSTVTRHLAAHSRRRVESDRGSGDLGRGPSW